MSLNWDISEIDDFKNKCVYQAERDDPSAGIKKGDDMISGVTDALIWATMSVGIPKITEENWQKFFARLNFYERLFSPWRRLDGKPFYFKPEDVQMHIGLKTNVPPETDARWRKRMWESHLDSVNDRIKDIETKP
jgi:hypothetical protein